MGVDYVPLLLSGSPRHSIYHRSLIGIIIIVATYNIVDGVQLVQERMNARSQEDSKANGMAQERKKKIQ